MMNPLRPLVASLKSVLPLVLCAGLLLMQATSLAAAPTLTGIAHFNGSNGRESRSDLVLGPDGLLYGTTRLGGVFSTGAVFKVTTGGTITLLSSLTGSSGSEPQGSVAFGPDGQLYGTAYGGGVAGYGTVWRVPTNGAGVVLASFEGTNGAYPLGGLTLAADGNFYGTTFTGADSGYFGMVFKLTAGGSLTKLPFGSITNASATGRFPYAPLAQASGGFYGTTYQGGSSGLGTIFRIATSGGSMSTVVSFTGTNGSGPQTGLTTGTDGSLYGVTRLGGGANLGTVFKKAAGPSTTVTTLASFLNATTDGAEPGAALVQGTDGNFYGTTSRGGSTDDGTVFRISPAGGLTRLASFSYSSSGYLPLGKMVFGPDGNLYGTTAYGGSSGNGTVYRVSGLDLTIVTQPVSTNVLAGANVSMAVTAFGSGPVTYQWRFNGTNIGGATSNSLVLANVRDRKSVV